jgi:hypothetical protein
MCVLFQLPNRYHTKQNATLRGDETLIFYLCTLFIYLGIVLRLYLPQ